MCVERGRKKSNEMMFDNKSQHSRSIYITLFHTLSMHTQMTFNQMERDLDAETGAMLKKKRKNQKNTRGNEFTDFVVILLNLALVKLL